MLDKSTLIRKTAELKAKRDVLQFKIQNLIQSGATAEEIAPLYVEREEIDEKLLKLRKEKRLRDKKEVSD